MEISIADQIALDDALVAPADLLKIGKCNLRLNSDVTSKEATLQVVYDMLKLTPFYKASSVTGDALEIYKQEFWASAFSQILWGMYNKKNVDYAYLLWEDFIFQIENKNMKKGNAMYYPRFTKLVVNFVMDKDPSIPRRNKVNWHYARDDPMFTTINVISRNEDTQLYGAILPVALTNEDIRNSESYKEYYAIASGTIPPKKKGSKKKANTDTIIKQKPPTAPKEKKSGKGKQKTTDSHASASAQDDDDADKNDVNETTQDDEVMMDHDEWMRNVQDDDDVEQTESDVDGDDFTITHPSRFSYDNEDSDNEVEGSEYKQINTAKRLFYPLASDAQYLANKNAGSSGRLQVTIEVWTGIQEELMSDIQKTALQGSNDDQEPSAGTDRGSKRRRSGKEPASTSAPSETTTTTAGKTTTTGSKTHKKSASQSAPSVPAVHESVQPWLSNLAQQDPRESFDELTDSTFDFSAFVMNRLNVQTLTPELLAGPTFELMKGTCKSLTELEYFCEEPLSLVPNSQLRRLRLQIMDIKWIEELSGPKSMWSQIRKILPLGNLTFRWQKAKDSSMICDLKRIRARDYEGMMEFFTSSKIGDFLRLRNQDIEILCVLSRVKEKVDNLQVEERIAFNDVGKLIRRKSTSQSLDHLHDPNLMKTRRYTPYSDPRGFIYENKDKKNRFDAHCTILHIGHKANARAMIQAIDKRLKTRRIMRSLERFVGGRPYGGDLRLLQRTI
ncbi:hypothetical protein Tco_0952976 [Tanacetum coccineum]|uniref:Uncharacterized protein n=1 Tax=Tanacetum coccineum TaxID=301880 RepID=A0ABQ5DYK8_9ASTR